ncbi:hypothetical protein PSV08DRAFT_47267 [Bipolaris maydis]|uniref:uncharacterized protein n=1 Tax=Cochliobolus heterostrophus TaxID=5016 RepID=UPI0024D8F7B5|nr:hypothetical protein J3E74DRAFT_23545 [Bipolaris maydis]KAJ6269560.1 hypothetical protein PSV08DRAFT_47267 [Bipolaris maydis]
MALSRVDCYDLLMTSHYTGVCYLFLFFLLICAREEETFVKLIFWHAAFFFVLLFLGLLGWRWDFGYWNYLCMLCVLLFICILFFLEMERESSAAIKD